MKKLCWFWWQTIDETFPLVPFALSGNLIWSYSFRESPRTCFSNKKMATFRLILAENQTDPITSCKFKASSRLQKNRKNYWEIVVLVSLQKQMMRTFWHQSQSEGRKLKQMTKMLKAHRKERKKTHHQDMLQSQQKRNQQKVKNKPNCSQKKSSSRLWQQNANK